MKLTTEQLEQINDIKNKILRIQQESEGLYQRAKLCLDTDDEDAYLHDYVYGNTHVGNILNKLKKKSH